MHTSDRLTRPVSWPSIGNGNICAGKTRSTAPSCLQLMAFFLLICIQLSPGF